MLKHYNNHISYVKDKLKQYSKDNYIFAKSYYKLLLTKRNITEMDIIAELECPKHLVFAYKETRLFNNKEEIRYRCYFKYSNTAGRCYILKFNHELRIITIFPLGKKTVL